MNLTEQIRQGAGQAVEALAEGWRELRDRAGGALTRFRRTRSADVERAPAAGESPAGTLPPIESWSYLAADVVEDGERIAVRLEIPGMRREDLTVELAGRTLRVSGEKRVDREFTRGGYQVVACAYGAFQRQVPLPVPVRADGAAATYRDGVLRVDLPKAAGARPSRIAVRVN